MNSGYANLRPILFRLDPERAHRLTVQLLRLAGGLPPVRGWLSRAYTAPGRPVQAFGLAFSNPLGLAAGYDKDGLAWRGLACLGFGHIEIGTVTLKPQPGNPHPRLFRLPEDQALINRLGFPGQGAEIVASRLRARRPPGLVLGANLGKNKDTPLAEAAGDYLALMRIFAPLADYLAINISSPNTVGLRRLQARDAIEGLLQAIALERRGLQTLLEKNIPILVKLAPDLSLDELQDALGAITGSGMDGVIAVNTTVSRAGLRSPLASESGGLSGAPLTSRSAEMLADIQGLTGGRLPVVSVGGILSAADTQARLDGGACLVQVYTGLVYRGPGLVKEILHGLAASH